MGLVALRFGHGRPAAFDLLDKNPFSIPSPLFRMTECADQNGQAQLGTLVYGLRKLR